MTRLNATAKAALQDAGVSQAEWARRNYTDGRWHGDACGCPDDRCTGYHHDGPDDCGCLPALLARAERGRAALTRPALTGDLSWERVTVMADGAAKATGTRELRIPLPDDSPCGACGAPGLQDSEPCSYCGDGDE